jgi:hypothetical protein
MKEKMEVQIIKEESKIPDSYRAHMEERALRELGLAWAKKYANKEEIFVYQKMRLFGHGGEFEFLDKRDDTGMAKKFYKYVHTQIKFTLE